MPPYFLRRTTRHAGHRSAARVTGMCASGVRQPPPIAPRRDVNTRQKPLRQIDPAMPWAHAAHGAQSPGRACRGMPSRFFSFPPPTCHFPANLHKPAKRNTLGCREKHISRARVISLHKRNKACLPPDIPRKRASETSAKLFPHHDPQTARFPDYLLWLCGYVMFVCGCISATQAGIVTAREQQAVVHAAPSHRDWTGSVHLPGLPSIAAHEFCLTGAKQRACQPADDACGTKRVHREFAPWSSQDTHLVLLIYYMPLAVMGKPLRKRGHKVTQGRMTILDIHSARAEDPANDIDATRPRAPVAQRPPQPLLEELRMANIEHIYHMVLQQPVALALPALLHPVAKSQFGQTHDPPPSLSMFIQNSQSSRAIISVQ